MNTASGHAPNRARQISPRQRRCTYSRRQGKQAKNTRLPPHKQTVGDVETYREQKIQRCARFFWEGNRCLTRPSLLNFSTCCSRWHFQYGLNSSTFRHMLKPRNLALYTITEYSSISKDETANATSAWNDFGNFEPGNNPRACLRRRL